MSYRELQETVRGLPWTLQEQVTGYARSVEDVLPSIFQKAGRAFDAALGDKIVFLAGVRKLHSIVASSYWTLENSGKLLETLDVSSIRAGGADLSRSGSIHARLGALVKSLEKTFEAQGVRNFLSSDYASLVQALTSDERL